MSVEKEYCKVHFCTLRCSCIIHIFCIAAGCNTTIQLRWIERGVRSRTGLKEHCIENDDTDTLSTVVVLYCIRGWIVKSISCLNILLGKLFMSITYSTCYHHLIVTSFCEACILIILQHGYLIPGACIKQGFPTETVLTITHLKENIVRGHAQPHNCLT